MRQSDFSIWSNVAFIFFLIPLFVSCGNSSGTGQNKDKQDTLKTLQLKINKIKDTCLIYFENENSLYTCCMRDLKTGDTVQLAHFSSLPMEALWDTTKKITYFFMKEGVMKCRYDSISGLEKISEPLGKDIIFCEAWIDSISGNIRFLYQLFSNSFTRVQKKLYENLSSKIDSNFLPTTTGGLAYVSELNKEGKIMIVNCEVLTTGELYYGNVNHIDSGLKREKKGVLRLSDMLKTTGIKAPSDHFKATQILPPEYSQYGLEKYKSETITFFEKIDIYMPDDIITAVVFGDSPHMSTPVLIYNKNTKKITEMKDIKYNTVTIIVYGNYVLFADEYLNSDIMVYNWKTQQKIISLKNGTGGFIARI